MRACDCQIFSVLLQAYPASAFMGYQYGQTLSTVEARGPVLSFGWSKVEATETGQLPQLPQCFI